MNVKFTKLKTYSIHHLFKYKHILTINNCLHSDLINTMKNALKLDCIKYGNNFIKNSNILPVNLWQDSLHLSNSGKGKLLNNFLVFLNKNYFLSKSCLR